MVDYGLDSAVSARSAPCCNAYAGKRQIKVVVNDQHLPGGNIEVLEDFSDRFPTPVHVGQRFHEKDFASFRHPGPPGGPELALLQARPVAPNQPVKDLEPGVVP